MKSVFISSTFKDMQAERDFLHEKIFPRLRKLVAPYGEDIQELDLRWGVDTYKMTEEESGYQVLRVCIDAIDRCKPYIIVLLGDRYGWVPDGKIIDSLHDERVKTMYEDSMSITNLEIKYGALSEEETLERCIFCFRNNDFLEKMPEDKQEVYRAESPEHEKRLTFLKEQICSKENAKVIEYQVQWDEEKQTLAGLEKLGEDIYKKLEEILSKELAGREAKNPIQQYLLDAEYTKERYLSTYTLKPYEEKEALEWMKRMASHSQKRHANDKYIYGKEQCIHLIGKAGSGKSAMMAYLEQQVKDAQMETILYFSGNPGCQNPETLKSVLIYRMEEILGMEHDLEPENQNAYLAKLDEKLKMVPVFCFIDALDQLFTDHQSAYLEIIDVCPNLYLITSSLDDFPYEQALMKARAIKKIQVKEFSNIDKKLLIDRTSAYRGKKIDDTVKDMICAKNGSGNPLFLSLLLQRLFAMRQEEFQQAESMAAGMDGLHLYMKQMIEEAPEQLEEMAVSLFERVSEMFQSSFFKKVAYLVALSNTGLTEREILEILQQQNVEISQLKFQEILYYLYDVFTEKEDGKWVFAHRIFYEAMRKDMEQEEEQIRQYFIDYSRVNPEFMKKEGFYHILKMKDKLGAKVLSECKGRRVFQQVEGCVIPLIETGDDYRKYFLEMQKGSEAESVFEFWKKANLWQRNETVNDLKRILFDRYLKDSNLTVDLKLDIIMQLLDRDTLEESTKHLKEARVLLPFVENEKARKFWKIQFDYIETYDLFQLNRTEEAFRMLNACVEGLKDLFDYEEKKEEVIYLYVFYNQMYAERSRRKLKQNVVQYLENALAMYEQYPEYADIRRFQLTKIEIYLECEIQYSKENSARATWCAKEALKLAREKAEKDPSVEVFELLARALNYYGNRIDRENRYKYRYECLEVLKRAYLISGTNYWQQKVATQAAFFAEDIIKLTKQLKLDDRSGWIQKGKEAQDLNFEYSEQLMEKKYRYVDKEYYLDTLLLRVQQENFEFRSDKVIHYAKKVYDCMKMDERNGWKPKENEELYRYWQASAYLAEYLDERLDIEEAVPYALEQLKWAKALPEGSAPLAVLAAFQIASRVLYHARQDEKAYAYAEEGLEFLNKMEKKDDSTKKAIRFELQYIKVRILLEKDEQEKVETAYAALEVMSVDHILSLWETIKFKLLDGDYLASRNQYKAARDAYEEAISYWYDNYKIILKNVDSLKEFRVRDGKVDRNYRERMWHTKAFFYLLYAVYQKAEVMIAGDLKDVDDAKSRRKRGFETGEVRNFEAELKYAYNLCMEKLREKDWMKCKQKNIPVAEKYLFKTVNRFLEQGAKSKWKGWGVNYLSYLFGMVSYCQEKNIDITKELQILVDAFCNYDLNFLMLTLEFKEMEAMLSSWTNIYHVLKEKMNEGLSVLPENKYLIGELWAGLGCYEEALKWMEAAPMTGEESIDKARRRTLLCIKAICAFYNNELKKVEEFLSEVTMKEEEYDIQSQSGLIYFGLSGKIELILKNLPSTALRQQEYAQRYLHVLQMIADQNLYPTLSYRAKRNMGWMIEMVRDAYGKGNRQNSYGIWEEKSAEIKKVTEHGITWEVPYKELDEFIFTQLGKIYNSCEEQEEKISIAAEICIFSRTTYKRGVIDNLSLETLLMFQKVEKDGGYAPFPILVETLAARMKDKDLLHEFFRKIPEYQKMEDWKTSARERLYEVKDIFERLLEKDPQEWSEDFVQWVSEETPEWIVANFSFFKNAEEIAVDPDRGLLYEMYRKSMIALKEKALQSMTTCRLIYEAYIPKN